MTLDTMVDQVLNEIITTKQVIIKYKSERRIIKLSPALMHNFNKYLGIMNQHDIYNDEIISIDSCSFLTPTIILPLVSFMYNYDKVIKDHKDPQVNDYLHKVLGIKKHTDTTFPFRWLDETTDNSEELTKEILRIIDPVPEMEQSLKYIFHEIITNVYDHSIFDNGFVIGQYWPKLNATDYCFMDNGISIPGSFKKAGISFKNDCDAIIQAINGVSTKDKDEFIGRGTGLNTVVNIVTQGARGIVLIASGNGVLEITKNNIVAKKIPDDYLKGTLVSLRVKSNKNIDIYEYMIGRKYELPKKIKRIKKKPIHVKKL